MATTEVIVRSFLAETAPHIMLNSWSGDATSYSHFLDTRTGKEFSQPFKEVRRVLLRNKDAVFGKTIRNTPESYVQKLAALCDHIQVITYGKERSTFRDNKRSIEFEEDNKQVLHRLKNPTHLFAPTKEEVVAKRGDTIEALYGVRHALQSPELLTRARDTLEQNYGVRNPQQSPLIRKKTEETVFEKYGVKTPSQDPVVRAKNRAASRIYVKDVPVSVFAETSEYSEGHLRMLTNKGVDVTLITEKGTILENQVKEILQQANVPFEREKVVSKFRPDFLLEDHKLIIECDGNYWHSDAVNKDKNYHVNKLKEYASLGYSSLFFRENEIYNSLPIITSIIHNRLGKSKRAFARKCTIVASKDGSWFATNHLMGAGQGRCYYLLLDNEIVAGIRVHWKDKSLGILDISRFCTKLGVSVVGGFSKLLSYVESVENPQFISNFIDRRYGTGAYLSSFGFEEKSTFPSFVWVYGNKVFHRMKFPGNTGYDHGYHKLWDCGQTKFVKTVN